eukprot:6857519-Prymnesium_polylepis.1
MMEPARGSGCSMRRRAPMGTGGGCMPWTRGRCVSSGLEERDEAGEATPGRRRRWAAGGGSS